MHQIRQKKPKPSKRNATNSSIAPTSGVRPTSADDRDTRSHRSRRAISSIASLVGAVRSSDERRDLGSLFSLSLSDLGSLFSLSLSLSPEVIWSENEGRNWFPGQRWKYWSTRSYFPENDIFRDSQTCRKGWKWFPEIIFTQNKRTLSAQKYLMGCVSNIVFFLFLFLLLFLFFFFLEKKMNEG